MPLHDNVGTYLPNMHERYSNIRDRFSVAWRVYVAELAACMYVCVCMYWLIPSQLL